MGRFSGKKCRLLSMLWLTTAFFFVEIVVGYITNSMALVADSFHMLSDVAALIVAFLSVKMSPKKWSKNTFGWARAEILGALVNAVFLVALCFSITVEACKRFIEKEEIHDPKLLVVVGCLGLLVNIIGLFLFHEHGSAHGGHSHHHHGTTGHPSSLSHGRTRLTQLAVTDDTEHDDPYHSNTPSSNTSLRSIDHQAAIAITNGRKHSNHLNHHHRHHSHSTNVREVASAGQMNMRGVFLHVLSDALGSVIVIISALVFWLTSDDWKYKYYIDPALSIVLVLLIMHSVWPLLRDSALILLQTVPTHIQVDAIKRRLLAKVDGVLAVHEFHVWQLTGDRIIASAHIRCRNLSEYMKIAEKVKEFFHNEGIHSTTIQPEFIDYLDYTSINEQLVDDCVLDCPKTTSSDTCVQNTCCGPSRQDRDTPSPRRTPVCRQRSTTANSGAHNSTPHQQDRHNGEVIEMEKGALLERHLSSMSVHHPNQSQLGSLLLQQQSTTLGGESASGHGSQFSNSTHSLRSQRDNDGDGYDS